MTESFGLQTQGFKTILDYLRFGFSEATKADLYYGHGTDNAWDDILSLILGSLALPFDLDPLMFHAQLTPAEKLLLVERLERRIHDRFPVPYLTQEAYFSGLSFYVDERVLIPRSPLAELIDQQFSPWIKPEQVHHVLDLCTGSACIAIACCYAFPEAMVDAIDISEEALDVAAINVQRYELSDQLTLIRSNCFDEISAKQYDIIVSNPPYVSHEEMQTMPPEYRHEPKLALEASDKGLAIVEKILFNAHDYLTDHGILVVEVGNSDIALIEAYPDVPFTWLDFEQGGHGVFLLTCQQLRDHFKRS